MKYLCALMACLPMAAWAQAADERGDVLKEIEELTGIVAEEFTAEIEQFLGKELPQAEAYLENLQSRMQEHADELGLKWEYLDTKLNMAGTARELREAMREYPEVYPEMKRMKSLEIESRQLAQRYHETRSDEEREQLRAELHGQLAEIFAINQALREKELQERERELERLRRTVETREENREAIVDRQVHVMLDDFDPYAF